MSIRLPSLSPLLICSAASVLVCSPGAFAGETLSMKFREGETYSYRITQNMTLEGEAQGQKFGSETGQTLFLRTDIKSIAEDGSAKAEQTIDRVQMKMVLSGPLTQTIEYDSDSEEEPSHPIAKQLAENASKMVGQAISMTITPRGQFKDVEIPDALAPSGPAGGAMPGGGDQLRQMFEQSGLRLPEGEVSVGDTWEHKMDPPLTLPFGTMQITTTYKYEGTIEDNLKKIGATMDVRLEPAENADVKVTAVTKEAAGSFLFDNASGKLKQSTIKQVMEVDLDGKAKQIITTDVMMTLIGGSEEGTDTSQ